MGLISWFKDKYNNHKFQKAKELLLDGKKEQAVEIFKEILNCHPDAPFELLSIYHSDIDQGNSNRISDVATLYENHHSVKNECIASLEEAIRVHTPTTVLERGYNGSAWQQIAMEAYETVNKPGYSFDGYTAGADYNLSLSSQGLSNIYFQIDYH